MSEKSHVGMGFNVCPVTGEEHSESVVIDKKMRESLDLKNFLGYAYSPEVAAKLAEGYIYLIEVKNQGNEAKMAMKDADRTGVNVCIKRDLAQQMFDIPEVADMQFVSSEVIEFLQNLKNRSDLERGTEEQEV
jgi:hypothetical protein